MPRPRIHRDGCRRGTYQPWLPPAEGGVELSRDVGQALGRNPCPIVVPCHRVLAAGNKPGGFSANGGVVTKLKLLTIEGAVVNHTPSLFD